MLSSPVLAEPGLDVVAVLGDLFALDGQAGTDPRPGTGVGVDAFGAAEAADGVGDERMDRLAGEVVAVGERVHDHRRSHVPDRAAQQHLLVAVDRGQRIGDRRSSVGVLLGDVAGDGRVVAVRVGVGRLDPEHVAVDQLGDHLGQHLGVADLQVTPPAVVVVLTRAGEVGQQDPAGHRGSPPVGVES